MTSERDVHPDEGTIHAWLDRQLDDASAATLEAHLQRCDECAERVAEARGLIAGASRILASLDADASQAPERLALEAVEQRDERRGEPRRTLLGSGIVSTPSWFRLTRARTAIAAVLVVAVATAIVREHERTSNGVAAVRRDAAEGTGAASVVAGAPLSTSPASAAAPMALPSAIAPALPPALAQVDSTAGARVAAARTFARAQRETTTSADLARVAPTAAPTTSMPTQQAVAAAKVADSAASSAANRLELRGAVQGVAAGASVSSGGARAAAPVRSATGVEAPECYRVESATGGAATWGPVSLPFMLALDAPATGAMARVLTPAGQEAEARAVYERRGGDSLLFTLRRIGYSGTLAVGAPGEVRAGVMRSAPANPQLGSVVVAGVASAAEQKRAPRKPAAAQARAADSASSSEREAAPAVPVVVRKVECGG